MKKYYNSSFGGFFALAVLPTISLRATSTANPFILMATLGLVLLIVLFKIGTNLKKKIWNYEDIGLGKKYFNLKTAVMYLLVTVIYCVGFVQIYPNHNHNLGPWTITCSLFISAAQSVICQSYMAKRGQELFKNSRISISVIVVLFTFMHSIYPSLGPLDYFLLFLAGLGFSLSYYFYPNILLVILFHTATNMLALHIGMFKSALT